MEPRSAYSFGRRLQGSFPRVLEQVRAALQEQGFGILTEIDVQAKLREKLEVDFRPYVILGACNPRLAHQALGEEPELGTLLPCNVVVYAAGGDEVVVTAMDPVAALGLVDNPAVQPVARQVRGLLEKALDGL